MMFVMRHPCVVSTMTKLRLGRVDNRGLPLCRKKSFGGIILVEDKSADVSEKCGSTYEEYKMHKTGVAIGQGGSYHVSTKCASFSVVFSTISIPK